jgi:hemerythrin
MGTEWDPTLALGHAEIDGQHKEIFRRYADLVEAMATGKAAELEALFAFLGDYAVEHFEAEEREMARTAYPGANVHAAAHARFVRDYGELVALWRSNGPTHGVAVKTSTWIGDWLRSHISGVDLALARYLRARRGAAETPPPG